MGEEVKFKHKDINVLNRVTFSMYSRKTETHRLLGRLIGQPMFRTLS